MEILIDMAVRNEIRESKIVAGGSDTQGVTGNSQLGSGCGDYSDSVQVRQDIRGV